MCGSYKRSHVDVEMWTEWRRDGISYGYWLSMETYGRLVARSECPCAWP
jgi:hypothetical protein